MSEHTRPFSRRAFVGTAAAFGISLCLPPLMPAKAHAVTAAEKQAEANAALEKLNAMQEKLDRAEVSLYAAETERDDAQARMDEAQGRIDSASSRISELQDKLGNRARSMYRSGYVPRSSSGSHHVPGLRLELGSPERYEPERRRHGGGNQGPALRGGI